MLTHCENTEPGQKRTNEHDPNWPKENLYTTYLGQKDWEWATRRLTAATVLDLTKEPRVGKYIMFFHGSFQEAKNVERGHGAASLAFAWSEDLINWNWAKKD